MGGSEQKGHKRVWPLQSHAYRNSYKLGHWWQVRDVTSVGRRMGLGLFMVVVEGFFHKHVCTCACVCVPMAACVCAGGHLHVCTGMSKPEVTCRSQSPGANHLLFETGSLAG